MKKLIILMMLLCAHQAMAHDYILDEDSKDASISMEDRVVIELKSNPTTGYNWYVSDVSDNISIFSSGYAAESKKIGGGGKYRIILKPSKPGRGMVNLEYKRIWEKDIKAAKSVRYNIMVNF